MAYGMAGFLAVIVFQVILIVWPFLWMLSLFPSRDMLQAPEMFGIGGGVFGIQYEYYLRVSTLFAVIGYSGLLGAFAVAKMIKPLPSSNSIIFGALKLRWADIVRTYKIDLYSFLIALVLFVLFFTANGWSRLWYSELGRFEQDYVPWLVFLEQLKIFLPSLLLVGTVSAASLCVAGKPYYSLLSIFLCVCPFISQASRGYSVIMPLMIFALAVRWRVSAWLAVIFSVLFAIYAISLPLKLRAEPDTGLAIFFKVHQSIIVGEGKSRQAVELISGVAQNISQGFAIMVDAVAGGGSGDLDDVPGMYWALSFSPTISAVDGFGVNYVHYTPFINFFTPFSAFAELYVLSPVLVFIVPLLWLSVYLWLMRRSIYLGPLGIVFSMIMLALFFSALIQAHQYPIRTTFRFVYLGVAIGFFGQFLYQAWVSRDRVYRK